MVVVEGQRGDLHHVARRVLFGIPGNLEHLAEHQLQRLGRGLVAPERLFEDAVRIRQYRIEAGRRHHTAQLGIAEDAPALHSRGFLALPEVHEFVQRGRREVVAHLPPRFERPAPRPRQSVCRKRTRDRHCGQLGSYPSHWNCLPTALAAGVSIKCPYLLAFDHSRALKKMGSGSIFKLSHYQKMSIVVPAARTSGNSKAAPPG
jgi:hypothetical protein